MGISPCSFLSALIEIIMSQSSRPNSSAESSDEIESVKSSYTTCSGHHVKHTLYRGKVSTLDKHEEDDQVINITNAVERIQTVIGKIRSDAKSTLSKTALTNLHDISTAINQVLVMKVRDEERIARLQSNIIRQQASIQKLKDELESVEENRQKSDIVIARRKIQTIVEKALKTHTDKLEETIQQIQKMTHTAETAPAEANNDTAEEQEPTTNQSHQHAQRKTAARHPEDHITQDTVGPQHRRTIIVRSVGATQRTGLDIKQLMEENRFFIPARVIQETQYRARHVEIVCTSPKAAHWLIRQLQLHQTLNKSLAFLPKQTPLQKMLLMGVQEGYEQNEIEQVIKETYDLEEGEIKILGRRSSRMQSQENWLILLPHDTSRSIINYGGIQIGFKFCKLSPFTSIQRCRKCQALDHTTQRCTSKHPYCNNCGEKHEEENCNRPPRCLNCVHHNRDHNTSYNTQHKASDPECHTYRKEYSNERVRLDNLFNYRSASNLPPRFQNQQMYYDRPIFSGGY